MLARFRDRFATWRPKYLALIGLGMVGAFAGGHLTGRGRGPAAGAHAPHGSEAADHGAASVYTCAMHPQIRQPTPGLCPICGMDLVPLEANAGGGEEAPERIVWSERAKALAKLRTTEVRRRADPAGELRLLGRVEADETGARTVSAWVGGRIDRLHVRATGERVRAGQAVATLYSPEVFAAHQDLIAARKQVERLREASPPARSAAEAALGAARDRLRLLGVSDGRLQAMERDDAPARHITISTSFGGTVVERLASEGAYLSTGDALYRVADLSKVWVQLDAYERDLGALRLGQRVRLSIDALPDEVFEGEIAFIDPKVDAARRTAKVRIEVDNRDGRLRPGMYAQATVAGSASSDELPPLVIPRSAPLFTGRRSVVYVEVAGAERPTYEARNVRLGPLMGDTYPVLAGLRVGERVVTRGAFALDADLQIRGGHSMMVGPDDDDDGPWDYAIDLPPSERAKLAPLLQAYLGLQRALAADDLDAARGAARTLAAATKTATPSRPPAAVHAFARLAEATRDSALALERSATLDEARQRFFALTTSTLSLLEQLGNPLDAPVSVAFCPMVDGGRGTWVQAPGTIDNPYYGSKMRTCGDSQHTVEAGSYLPKQRTAPAAAAQQHEGHQH